MLCCVVLCFAVVVLLSAGSIESRHRYYFMIGSVDSFERKLDEAQRELGISAAAHVPVKYAHEVSICWPWKGARARRVVLYAAGVATRQQSWKHCSTLRWLPIPQVHVC